MERLTGTQREELSDSWDAEIEIEKSFLFLALLLEGPKDDNCNTHVSKPRDRASISLDPSSDSCLTELYASSS